MYSHPNISSKINLINKELGEISNWFKANKLSVNASKTNYMILGTPHITNKYIDANEQSDGDGIDSSTRLQILLSIIRKRLGSLKSMLFWIVYIQSS